MMMMMIKHEIRVSETNAGWERQREMKSWLQDYNTALVRVVGSFGTKALNYISL